MSLFDGDGEMAARCRALDWAATPLGPVEAWPPALRTIVRTAIESPFPINLWCGPELVLVYNDGYRHVLGAKHPRALGRPGREVWSEIWGEIAPMFDDIRAGGGPVFAEDARFVMERSEEGADAYFTFGLSAVRDEAGAIVAFLNIVSETTARIVAERTTSAALASAERAEARLREVFAQAPAFLAVLRGSEHVFEFANAAYLQLVGHRDVLGKPAAAALPEVREQGFIDLLDGVLRTGTPFIGREVPLMLARTSGAPLEQRYVDFVYQPLTEGDGRAGGIVAHGSDVTAAVEARREVERLLQESERARAALESANAALDQQRAELEAINEELELASDALVQHAAEAEASETRYRFLANAIPVQVWTATPEGALDYVSDRVAADFGRTTEQVLGEGWLTVLHPDDLARTTERWAQSLRTGEPYEVEFRLWNAAEGRHRWHLARAIAQRDEHGDILRWFGSNTDIEAWKRAEAELKRLHVEATEANRAKSDFLAAMSHELRTPLNAIGGYAQLIEMGVRGPVTEEQRIDLLKIQRSKNHLDALVADVLSFAKLGSGRIELRSTRVPVGPTIGAVLEMVGPQLQEKGLALGAGRVPEGLAVTGDADKIRQVLVNLCANALKFTPRGGTLTIDVGEAGTHVAIGVADTGIGIPAAKLEAIFEPFVQAGRALNSSDNGVGLGLAISRQLARAMGGDLTVTSTLGVGSRFVLSLPTA